MRHAGRFPLGDALARRFTPRRRPVRLALAVCTLAVYTLYLVAQLVGSSALMTRFAGQPGPTTRMMAVIIIATIVTIHAAIGGRAPPSSRSSRPCCWSPVPAWSPSWW
ncbi:sodium:solute symporter family transporter [Streptomyces stelliscabiei]|uniref:sodium:solute symporter family transporter n=1 Tax=Streptomyces stelliscabiei TaxID=146820 RepID=UPI002FF3C716